MQGIRTIIVQIVKNAIMETITGVNKQITAITNPPAKNSLPAS